MLDMEFILLVTQNFPNIFTHAFKNPVSLVK